MNITGPESLLMGVDDLAEARRFLTIYGLRELDHGAKGATFEALDGSGVDLRLTDDPSLPAANVRGPTLRAAIWGVQDKSDLDAIAEELGRDRQVTWADGVLQSTDDDQNALYFRVTQAGPMRARVSPGTSPASRPSDSTSGSTSTNMAGRGRWAMSSTGPRTRRKRSSSTGIAWASASSIPSRTTRACSLGRRAIRIITTCS